MATATATATATMASSSVGVDSDTLQSGCGAPPYSTEQKSHFMRKALRVAVSALEKREVPVGCVIVYNGSEIAHGLCNFYFLLLLV